MTRFNSITKFAGSPSSAWGKNISAILFAALLIVCSITVGCSSDKPKTVGSNNQIPVTQSSNSNPTLSANMPAAGAQDTPKPATKKVVRKRPANVTYTDKTYGVSFEYPRKYGLETGDATNELIMANPVPMNFVQPGGIALAGVGLPDSSFPATDFSSGFFSVSVNKSLTAEQCGEFSVPQPKETAGSSVQTASASKLMIGDMELQGTEAVSGEGSRQSDSKYFHVFENGACYEFALNVTTLAGDNNGGMKHVDRDKVFARLEKILSTVKIDATPAPQVADTNSATPIAAAPVSAATPAESSGSAQAAPAVSTPAAAAPAEPAPGTPTSSAHASGTPDSTAPQNPAQ
jgi:hypothetical protein